MDLSKNFNKGFTDFFFNGRKKEMYSKYSHRDYLGGLIKLGIKREKFGSNKLKKAEPESFFKRYMKSFNDPIITILLIALTVNVIFTFFGIILYVSVFPDISVSFTVSPTAAASIAFNSSSVKVILYSSARSPI